MRIDPNPKAFDREHLDRNIRRTVAISALRKIRKLVDDYDDERTTEHRVTRIVVASVVVGCIALALLAATGVLGHVIRSVAGVISATPAAPTAAAPVRVDVAVVETKNERTSPPLVIRRVHLNEYRRVSVRVEVTVHRGDATETAIGNGSVDVEPLLSGVWRAHRKDATTPESIEHAFDIARAAAVSDAMHNLHVMSN